MTDIHRLDDDLRRILTHLADELLPLTPWLNDAKPYTPPGALPWREGPGPWSLTMSDLGFLSFFEGLLAETSGDIDLVARFERVSRDPLASCPILDVESWRAGRGLAKAAQFDIGDSRNMPVDDKNRLCSRAPLYAEFWPLLRATVGQSEADAKAAGAPLDWSRLTAELLTDRCKSWPYWQPRASSTFMRQLRKDVLYAALGARNPAPLPWRYAVLIELGEHRRPGNSYTRADAAAAVEEFWRAWRTPPAELAPGEGRLRRIPVPPPVGAPSVNAKFD